MHWILSSLLPSWRSWPAASGVNWESSVGNPASLNLLPMNFARTAVRRETELTKLDGEVGDGVCRSWFVSVGYCIVLLQAIVSSYKQKCRNNMIQILNKEKAQEHSDPSWQSLLHPFSMPNLLWILLSPFCKVARIRWNFLYKFQAYLRAPLYW